MQIFAYSSENGVKEGVVFVDDDFEGDPEDFEQDGLKYVDTIGQGAWTAAVAMEQMYLRQ